MRELTLVKLGGSLITDKTRPLTPRVETLARLADEIAGSGREGSLIVGHGSGSFGHVAAARHGIRDGARTADEIAGVAATQVHAHRLHRLVVETLWRAGCRPFSCAPSSALVATAGRPGTFHVAPVVAALELGLLPVTLGDVVMDTAWGASICSTEQAFEALVAALAAAGHEVERVLWMGDTDGVLDASGASVPSIDARNAAAVERGLGTAAGQDVTGGIGLRLATARRLAERGIESWILDGLEPGVLAAALAGRRVSGTRVAPHRPPPPDDGTR
jgi:isopentenyl phosphate kinase